MTETLSEAATGNAVDLVFPDEAAYQDEYRLRDENVYSAEEVCDEIGNSDVPRYGRWLPVEIGPKRREGWLNAPSALIEELVDCDISAGDAFGITEMQKSGTRESDPYTVELHVFENGK